MDNNSANPTQTPSHGSATPILWWTTLVVAVLAVPSFGVAVSLLFPFRGVGELVIFVLACWLCTYLGMKLMSNPKMNDKIELHKKS